MQLNTAKEQLNSSYVSQSNNKTETNFVMQFTGQHKKIISLSSSLSPSQCLLQSQWRSVN